MAEGYYYVVFGKGDGSDYMDCEIDLDDAEQEVYDDYLFRGWDPNCAPELQAALDTARGDIEVDELDLMIENEDPYAMECQGLYTVDPDVINELVAARDAHAMEFFELGDLTEEELEEWDAYDLDELPTIADFDPDFEPESPFEGGYSLTVRFRDLDGMDLTPFTFPVYINHEGETEVQIYLTEDDSCLMRKALEAGEVEDSDELAGIRDKIFELALEKVKEDLNETGELSEDPDYDPQDDYEITVDYSRGRADEY